MALATPNLSRKSTSARAEHRFVAGPARSSVFGFVSAAGLGSSTLPSVLAVLLLAGRTLVALASDTQPAPSAQQAFKASKKENEAHLRDSQAACSFARAALD